MSNVDNIILKFSKARLKVFKHFMVKLMISFYIIDILTRNAFKNTTKYNSQNTIYDKYTTTKYGLKVSNRMKWWAFVIR